ncbi:hypothetical protein PoB_002321900 [Plakobranchus ocellatus]|uniref:Uncharacterized protein n=1 Tax=Plakobranchus ocellatus TaxID=259542 RepID=A0AAV3ZS64_9GAST|nr:hypothetical protein PoB_002321900 [Plakobranchus ocellatus]
MEKQEKKIRRKKIFLDQTLSKTLAGRREKNGKQGMGLAKSDEFLKIHLRCNIIPESLTSRASCASPGVFPVSCIHSTLIDILKNPEFPSSPKNPKEPAPIRNPVLQCFYEPVFPQNLGFTVSQGTSVPYKLRVPSGSKESASPRN